MEEQEELPNYQDTVNCYRNSSEAIIIDYPVTFNFFIIHVHFTFPIFLYA